MIKQLLRVSVAALLVASTLLAGCGQKAAPASSAASATAGSAASDASAAAPAEPGSATAASDVKIAMVFANLGDMGFMDEAFAGLKRANEELGITYDYVECPMSSDAETQMRMFADAEEYDLIMVIGADKKDSIGAVAADYPDQKFSLVDSGVEDLPNLHGVGANDPEQTFLSGVIAGLVTQDDRLPLSNPENVIGFVGGMDSPASRAGATGFLAGAKFVNPDVEILYTIIGDYKDPGKAKEVALTAYGRGADIMSHNAGASGMGVFSASAEVNRYVIGSSLASVDPERSLCTSMKLTDLFVYQEIESIINGTWAPGSTKKGIKEGVCDYNIENLKTELPEDIIAKVEEVKQMVVDGKIVLPQDPNEIEAWLKTNQYGK